MRRKYIGRNEMEIRSLETGSEARDREVVPRVPTALRSRRQGDQPTHQPLLDQIGLLTEDC